MIALSTERLRLRAFRDGDAEFIFRLHQHPGLARFIPSAHTPDLATASKHLERFSAPLPDPRHGFSVVELRTGPEAGTAIGMILVKPIPPSGGGTPTEVEVGWRQLAEHCGNGYISEAAQAVLDVLLDSGLDHVVAVTDPANIASQRVATRIGMREIGMTRDYYDAETLLFRAP